MDPFQTELTELLPRLRRFARSLAGSMADGDDLVQSALEKALTHRDSYVPGTRMDSWLFRIIRNLAIDAARTRKRRPSVELDEADGIAVEGADTEAETRLMLRKTQDAIADLPEEQREVLCLVTIEGLPYKEAAGVLGIPIGTVMSRLSRARAAVTAAVHGAPEARA
jgi:RNA polymerase sigma-70 factor, ECF subfamily